MKYKEFTLDPFQEQAIRSLLEGNSVVVSAATGTGKTLIADFMIDHAIKEGQKVFYTAPIKALSNQKYRDFCTAYGKERIGLLTGDLVINPEAQIVVMTTEIYRNMLHEGSRDLQGLRFVVFDEIHFINDVERGTVWEECIIFSPDYVRFICLSATIPNYKQFAAWIESIAQHKVDTVAYSQRAVPLEHYVYEYNTGLTSAEKLAKDMKQDKDTPDYYRVMKKKSPKSPRQRYKVASHLELVRELHEKDWLPAIFFVFSRKATLEKAQELAKKMDFTTPDQKAYIIQYMRQNIPSDITSMPSVQALRELLPRGVGVHNAGILPKMKEIVEHLFNESLLKVLYATETFAVGINMPAKTSCFGAIEKYDGTGFRYLHSKEYYQCAGRAGRRGIDKVGRSIVMVDKNTADIDKIRKVTESDSEPIVSQYKLSYNTVLNLINNYDEETIDVVLKSNFGYFVKKQSQQQVRITTSFNNYKRILVKLGYVKDDKLTPKGEFTTHIYSNELFIGELVLEGYLDNFNVEQINVLLAALIYEGRRADKFDTRDVKINSILKALSDNAMMSRKLKKMELKKMYHLVSIWSRGGKFTELLDICNLPEGDIIRIFRQLVDILRQIKSGLVATRQRPELVQTIEKCIRAVDRDVVAVVM